METVPKDVVELITNKLSPEEFLNYCKSEIGKKFCANNDIWARRIQKDFGNLLQGRNKDKLFVERKSDPKKAYLEFFTKTSKAAEELSDTIYHYMGEKFTKFLKKKYKLHLYQNYFDFLIKIVNEIDIDNFESPIEYTRKNRYDLMNFLPNILEGDDTYYRIILEDLEGVIHIYVTEIFEPFGMQQELQRGRQRSYDRGRSPQLSPRGRSPYQSPQLSPQDYRSPPQSPRF